MKQTTNVLTKSKLRDIIWDNEEVQVVVSQKGIFLAVQIVKINKNDLESKLRAINEFYNLNEYELSNIALVNRKKMIKCVDTEHAYTYYTKNYESKKEDYGWFLIVELNNINKDTAVQFEIKCVLKDEGFLNSEEKKRFEERYPIL